MFKLAWPDLAKFRHFGNNNYVFSNSLWQCFEPTLANFYAIGQIFLVVISQILKNDLAIWSHWCKVLAKMVKNGPWNAVTFCCNNNNDTLKLFLFVLRLSCANICIWHRFVILIVNHLLTDFLSFQVSVQPNGLPVPAKCSAQMRRLLQTQSTSSFSTKSEGDASSSVANRFE